MTDQPAGPIVDALGVRVDLDEHQHLTDVVLLGRLSDAESGEASLLVSASDGLDWIGQLGLLAAAQAVVERDVGEAP